MAIYGWERDEETFTNYYKDAGLMVRAVQAIFQDDKERLWVGGGGLYCMSGDKFINITQDGPWN